MTELKIKQADINNNGNQKLMGENGGRGETQNTVWIVFGRGCLGLELRVAFFSWKYVKCKREGNSDGMVHASQKSSYISSATDTFNLNASF